MLYSTTDFVSSFIQGLNTIKYNYGNVPFISDYCKQIADSIYVIYITICTCHRLK